MDEWKKDFNKQACEIVTISTEELSIAEEIIIPLESTDIVYELIKNIEK